MVFSNSREQPPFEHIKSKLSLTAEGATLGTATDGELSLGADLSLGSLGLGFAGALSRAKVLHPVKLPSARITVTLNSPGEAKGTVPMQGLLCTNQNRLSLSFTSFNSVT